MRYVKKKYAKKLRRNKIPITVTYSTLRCVACSGLFSQVLAGAQLQCLFVITC